MYRFLALSCLFAVCTANVKLQRTIDSVGTGVTGSVVIDSGCSSSDTYGSNVSVPLSGCGYGGFCRLLHALTLFLAGWLATRRVILFALPSPHPLLTSPATLCVCAPTGLRAILGLKHQRHHQSDTPHGSHQQIQHRA